MDPTTVTPTTNEQFYTFELLNALAAALQARSDLVAAEREGEMSNVTTAGGTYEEAAREFFHRFSDFVDMVRPNGRPG